MLHERVLNLEILLALFIITLIKLFKHLKNSKKINIYMNNTIIEPSNNFMCHGTQRRKLESLQHSSLTKDERRKLKMNQLKDKYFSKIVNTVVKANQNCKKECRIFYNYYDLINDGLGKPHGLLNEFMMEMSYLYSEYACKNPDGGIITFKTLFGEKFNWKLYGKNMMIISW